MKNFKLTFVKAFIVLSGLSIGLSSCLKDNDDDYVAPDYAALSIYHASPGTEEFNVAIGQAFVNDGYYPLTFDYSQRLGYVLLTAGNRKITLVKDGTQDSLRSQSFNFEKDKYYSLFVVDVAPNPNFLLLQDDLQTPAANNASIRFVNLSPDAGNLTLVANAGADSVLFTDRAYKSATPFINLPATKTYTFEIKEGDTSKAILEGQEIISGYTYTIWAKGLDDTTNDTLKTSLKVSQHVMVQ